MSGNKCKYLLLEIPVWQATVIFLPGLTENMWEYFYQLRHEYLTDEDYKKILDDIKDISGVDGSVWEGEGSGEFLVFIRDPHDPNTIAYEIFHATNNVLLGRGVEHTDSDEPWANRCDGNIHNCMHLKMQYLAGASEA